MRKVLIKIHSANGPTFHFVNEYAIEEVREFCKKVGYGYKIIGIRRDDNTPPLNIYYAD